jgi:hypothetical protein
MSLQELIADQLQKNNNAWQPLFRQFRKYENNPESLHYGYSPIKQTQMSADRQSNVPDPPWYP